MNFCQDFNSLDILIPVRIDSKERHLNLFTLLSYLYKNGLRNIHVLEADNYPKIKIPPHITIDYEFINDSVNEFRKNKYSNAMYCKCNKYAAVWDADIILSVYQVKEALALLSEGADLVLPYDGRCLFLDKGDSIHFRKSLDLSYAEMKGKLLLGRPSVGGVYFVNIHNYLSYGGENERFIGWGPEDSERIKRLEILGASMKRSSGCAFHMFHPINKMKSESSYNIYRNNQREFLRICGMSRFQLKDEISKWINGDRY